MASNVLGRHDKLQGVSTRKPHLVADGLGLSGAWALLGVLIRRGKYAASFWSEYENYRN